MPKGKKQPLGIETRKRWWLRVLEERRDTILEAIDRYSEAETAVPGEWVHELNDLNEKIVRLESSKVTA